MASSVARVVAVGDDVHAESARRLGRRHAIERGPDEQVREPVGAEPLAVGRQRFGDAVRVEQDAVAALELLCRDLDHRTTEAHRHRRPALELTDVAAIANQHRQGMAGVEPGEHAAREVQRCDLSRDVERVPELVGDDSVDLAICRFQRGLLAAGVAQAVDRRDRHQHGRHAADPSHRRWRTPNAPGSARSRTNHRRSRRRVPGCRSTPPRRWSTSAAAGDPIAPRRRRTEAGPDGFGATRRCSGAC